MVVSHDRHFCQRFYRFQQVLVIVSHYLHRGQVSIGSIMGEGGGSWGHILNFSFRARQGWVLKGVGVDARATFFVLVTAQACVGRRGGGGDTSWRTENICTGCDLSTGGVVRCHFFWHEVFPVCTCFFVCALCCFVLSVCMGTRPARC